HRSSRLTSRSRGVRPGLPSEHTGVEGFPPEVQEACGPAATDPRLVRDENERPRRLALGAGPQPLSAQLNTARKSPCAFERIPHTVSRSTAHGLFRAVLS